MDEQIDQEEDQFDLPMFTKAGIMLPGLPIGLMEALHWGITPVALTTLGLLFVASQSPALVKKVGENERILLALSARPELLCYLDKLTRSHFSEQINDLRKRKPKLFHEFDTTAYIQAAQTLPIVDAVLEPMEEQQATVLVAKAKRSISPMLPPPLIEENEEEELIPVEEALLNCLSLSPTFRPSADSFLSSRIAVLGQPGAGKSNTIADIIEEIGPLGVPLILMDTEDEYDDLAKPCYLPKGMLAGAKTVNIQNAYAFGHRILHQRLQVILNLQSYENDDEAALVMCGIITGMNAWEEARPSEQRVTSMVILDEAAVWLPQNAGESILSKEKDDIGMTVLARLQKTFFSMVVRRGRKRGIGFLLATQRIAEIDKRALSATWMILHRQTLPNDLQIYARYGIEQDDAMNLLPGQAYVLGPSSFREIVQFRKRKSEDKAFTPGLASLRNPLSRVSQADTEEEALVSNLLIAHTAREEEEQFTPASKPSRYYHAHPGSNQMARTLAREQRLRGDSAQFVIPGTAKPKRPAVTEQPQPEKKEELPNEMAQALACWQKGSQSGRSLAAAMQLAGYDTSEDRAYKLMNALEQRGLIVIQRKRRPIS